jgi:hypothetical protein
VNWPLIAAIALVAIASFGIGWSITEYYRIPRRYR